MNDVLTLNIYNGADGNAPVAWRSITPVVEQMELLATKATELLRQNFQVPPSTSSLPASKGARLLIAGPPRRGSIILPFVLDLPSTLAFSGLAVHAGINVVPPIIEYVGALADLTSIATFVRDLLFGQYGLVARRTDQMIGNPPSTAEGRALENGANWLTALTPEIEKLLQAAEATGCEQLDLQVNDQAAIKLIMGDRRRRSALLARAPRPVWGNREGPPKGYFFDPADPAPMQRRTNAMLEVEYEGRPMPAVLLHMTSPTNQAIVAIWGAQLDLPKSGETVEIRGTAVDKRDVKPLGDVPDEFESATDVYLVNSARPSWR